MIWLLTVVTAFAEPSVADEVHQRLLVRDGFVGCEALFDLGDEAVVRDALVAGTAVQQPPWVPIRAAECVVDRASSDPVALEVARGWMKDPAVPGFALVVVQRLDAMPEERAVELANLAVQRAATDSRFARYARRPMEASAHPPVRELATRLPETVRR